MISENELIEDPVRQFEQNFTGRQAMIWTALPGIIQSFNADALTCEVQPAIQGRRATETGSVEILNLPLLLDCPVVFPHAGGCSLTFPIRTGDECLVVFSSRSIDLWWQSGGVQPPAEPRMHDLSDGFVIPGVWSQAKKIGSVSTDSVELRTDDRGAYIALTPSNHQVTLKTSGSAEASIGGTLSAAVSGTVSLSCPKLTIDCPETTFTGKVTVSGDIVGGAQIYDSTGKMQSIRDTYNSHTHNGGSAPDQKM